jgi:hypothetical protein
MDQLAHERVVFTGACGGPPIFAPTPASAELGCLFDVIVFL